MWSARVVSLPARTYWHSSAKAMAVRGMGRSKTGLTSIALAGVPYEGSGSKWDWRVDDLGEVSWV